MRYTNIELLLCPEYTTSFNTIQTKSIGMITLCYFSLLVDNFCLHDQPITKCHNGGECTPELLGYACNCTEEWEGDTCNDCEYHESR